jgi:hypothetical protein
VADRRKVAFIAAGVAAIVALLAIPVTRRLIGALLIAAATLGGCEILVGSYTERHCSAFSEAWTNRDPTVGEEVLALATPPEGEEVVPAVHDAANLLAFALLTDAPEDEEARHRDALLAECAKVTE